MNWTPTSGGGAGRFMRVRSECLMDAWPDGRPLSILPAAPARDNRMHKVEGLENFAPSFPPFSSQSFRAVEGKED